MDYEKLVMDVMIDGLIYLKDVLKEVVKILIYYFMLFFDECIIFDSEVKFEIEEFDEIFLYMC